MMTKMTLKACTGRRPTVYAAGVFKASVNMVEDSLVLSQ